MSKEQEQRLDKIEKVMDVLAAMEPPAQLNSDAILQNALGLDPEALRIEQEARETRGENVSLASLTAEKLGLTSQEFNKLLKEGQRK
jgi:hypothetical protein